MWVTKERQSQKIPTVNKAAFLIQGNSKTLGLDGEQKIAWVLFNSVLSEKVVKSFGLRNGCKVSHFGMKIEKYAGVLTSYLTGKEEGVHENGYKQTGADNMAISRFGASFDFTFRF